MPSNKGSGRGNDRANQHNPNNPAQQHRVDNRADHKNPNHPHPGGPQKK